MKSTKNKNDDDEYKEENPQNKHANETGIKKPNNKKH